MRDESKTTAHVFFLLDLFSASHGVATFLEGQLSLLANERKQLFFAVLSEDDSHRLDLYIKFHVLHVICFFLIMSHIKHFFMP